MRNVSIIVTSIRRTMARKKWVSFAFRLSITLLLLVFLCKSLSLATLFAALKQTTYVFLLLGLLIGVVASSVSAYQWQILLRAEQIRVSLARLFKLYLIGISFSHFLPTGMGGDVVKAWYVGRASGNYAGSASAVVITRLSGYFGMQLVAFSALLLVHSSLSRGLVLWAILLSLLIGSMIGGVILITAFLPGVLIRTRVKSRLLASVQAVGEALIATIRRPRLFSSVTGVGVVFWVLSVLDYYTYASALHMRVPLSFYFVAIPIVSLVAFLPITINGFGLRESAFVSVFATVHVPTATALLLALMMDVQVLFFGMIGGCLYLTMNKEERMVKPGRETHNSETGARQWFPEEEHYVFDAAMLDFDDTTPTLPVMLLSKPGSLQGERTCQRPFDTSQWQEPDAHKGRPYMSSLPSPHVKLDTPVLRESQSKAVFGKNRRVILVKDENEQDWLRGI